MSTRATHVVGGAIGVVLLAAAWELLGSYHVLGSSFPPLSAVLAYAFAPDHRVLLVSATARTAAEAALGFVIGVALGSAFAMIAQLVPALEPGAERLAAIVSGIPVVAVGSLCSVTFPAAVNPIVVAVLATYFIVFVAAASGLRSSRRTHRELFAALGASRWTTFARLDVPSAIPAFVDGMRAAAPVCVVGAIIGEWFASENGLGPLLVNAMQNYQTGLLWSAALAGSVLSAVLYGVLGTARSVALRRYGGR